jgi:Subtilase family.
VKILPPKSANPYELYGAITEQAIALAEIANPNMKRILCMAVTSQEYNTLDGSPTSWSASIDNITSAADEESEKRLFFISAGNVCPDELNVGYPNSNTLHSIESPGQAWNAITVGAYSQSIVISDSSYKDYSAVADAGELSPYSSTSETWSSKWPIKPEILLDGGNMGTNGSDFTECADLSLLTTNYRPLLKQFSTIWGTSSATAQAAWMGAQLFSRIP